MSEVLLHRPLDRQRLPRDLTPSERIVAEIAIDFASGRDNKTVNLTEVVEEWVRRTGKKPKNVRTTVNHFIKSVCLKTWRVPELGYRLTNRGNLGRGNIAEFTWIKV